MITNQITFWKVDACFGTNITCKWDTYFETERKYYFALLLSFYSRSYFRVSSRQIKNKSMIIGVSPFSEAVPGKPSLESLESKSYAILRRLRAARTEVARRLSTYSRIARAIASYFTSYSCTKTLCTRHCANDNEKGLKLNLKKLRKIKFREERSRNDQLGLLISKYQASTLTVVSSLNYFTSRNG